MGIYFILLCLIFLKKLIILQLQLNFFKSEQITLVDGVKEYHTRCFKCKKCSTNFSQYYYPLNEIPYCLTCFCSVQNFTCRRCNQLIDEGTVMRSDIGLFHMEKCFRCGECSKEFGPNSSFFTDGELPYCENHLPKKCAACAQYIAQSQPRISALDRLVNHFFFLLYYKIT